MVQPSADREANAIRARSLKALLALTILCGLSVPVVSYGIPGQFKVIPEEGFAMISRGPIEVVVTKEGLLESADNAELVNQCEYSTYIISLVPEGTWVEAGDIVAELDSSDLERLAQKRELYVIKYQALLKQAEEDLRIQQLTNQSRLADAKLALELAELDLRGYESAAYPEQLHKLQATVALAEEAVTRAEDQLAFTRKMVTRGYRQRNDEESDRLKLLKAKQSLSNATDKLDIFRTYTHQRNLQTYNAKYNDAIRDLDKVHDLNKSATLSREIKLRSRQRSFDIYRNYLDQANRCIEACQIRATRSGEVVHGTITPTSSRKLEERSKVRYRQVIARIPNRSSMQVRMRIHESKVDQIHQGMTAVLEIGAVTDRPMVGKVSEISSVPLSPRYPNYELREYGVVITVEIDPEMEGLLAPGMTSTAHIISAVRQDTLLTPLQSVVEVAGQHIVFVRHGDDVFPREVTIGLTNDKDIEIIDGLDEGEEIVLKPRVTCAQRLITLEGRYLASTTSPDWADWLPR